MKRIIIIGLLVLGISWLICINSFNTIEKEIVPIEELKIEEAIDTLYKTKKAEALKDDYRIIQKLNNDFFIKYRIKYCLVYGVDGQFIWEGEVSEFKQTYEFKHQTFIKVILFHRTPNREQLGNFIGEFNIYL